MSRIDVLKFGSSILRSLSDLPAAVDEIYRRWRSGHRVIAVVSAFQGMTEHLIAEVQTVAGQDCPEATAAYVSTGEDQTAALLLGQLSRHGIPARLVSPHEIGLIAEGSPLDSIPVGIDLETLERLLASYPVLVLPGFYGADSEGRTALFGRGGSDISALFMASALGARCRLLKDVPGVFDGDPQLNAQARRFAALSWERAGEVAGPLIQPKGLQFARDNALPFEVGRANEAAVTRVGHTQDEWAVPDRPRVPLKIALIGCGVVGRGVYDRILGFTDRFEMRHVVVRDIVTRDNVERYRGIENLTTDPTRVLEETVDVVIVCSPGTTDAYRAILSALRAGKFVITANKAAVAAHGLVLTPYIRGPSRRLWYSAAVGGALPALETLDRLESPVREIRGILNGTCGVVLDAWARGATRDRAIALAQAQGFAEADPARDLSGCDSADKLALLIESAFGLWMDPNLIATRGIDTLTADPSGYKLIARARLGRSAGHAQPYVIAGVAPECPPSSSFLGRASGPENRLEIELESGEIVRLRGQGAGRWPTTVSVMGDLHEIARIIDGEFSSRVAHASDYAARIDRDHSTALRASESVASIRGTTTSS